MSKNYQWESPAGEHSQTVPDGWVADHDEEHELAEEVPGSDVSNEQLTEDVRREDSWLHYNGSAEYLGYSPAARLTPENVDTLTHDYSFETDVGFLEVAPIVVPGDDDAPPVMYLTGGQTVHAVDARTGEEYWRFTSIPHFEEDAKFANNAEGTNRGVSVWQDKIFHQAYDARVIALDRYTGEKRWETLAVSSRQKEKMEPSTDRLRSTSPPIVHDGVVLTSQSGTSGGWGSMVALDAETGEITWEETIIPEDEWIGETWKFADGNAWMPPAVDPESGLVFFPAANPSPQLNGTIRPGPNKHTETVFAIDIESGETRWTHQLIAHDWWDYDTHGIHVFDMEVDGEERRVLNAINKTGWLYFIDVETGELVERSEPYANQGAEVPFMGVVPGGRENRKVVSPTDLPGATDWFPDGYSPKTGMHYTSGHDSYKMAWHETDWSYDEETYEYDPHLRKGGAWESVDDEEYQRQARTAATDPATGEVVWTYEIGDVTAAGNTPTGGNLVFNGDDSGTLRALDAESGELVWEDDVGDSIWGVAPVVWDDPGAGKQYVAIAAAGSIHVYSGGEER